MLMLCFLPSRGQTNQIMLVQNEMLLSKSNSFMQHINWHFHNKDDKWATGLVGNMQYMRTSE